MLWNEDLWRALGKVVLLKGLKLFPSVPQCLAQHSLWEWPDLRTWSVKFSWVPRCLPQQCGFTKSMSLIMYPLHSQPNDVALTSLTLQDGVINAHMNNAYPNDVTLILYLLHWQPAVEIWLQNTEHLIPLSSPMRTPMMLNVYGPSKQLLETRFLSHSGQLHGYLLWYSLSNTWM